MRQGPSRAAIAASLIAAATLVWWVSVTSAVAREVEALGGPSPGNVSDRGVVARPSPDPLPELRRRERGRTFDTPPGHRARPARDVAPGHARVARHEPAPTPTGAVLGATPPAVRSGGAVAVPASRGPVAPGPAANAARLGGATPAGGAQPFFSREQARSAGLAGAFLAFGAVQVNDAVGAEIAASASRDPVATALLLLIVGTQILAAAACIPVARRILGGFGTSRLR
jgi:hypothetical protein